MDQQDPHDGVLAAIKAGDLATWVAEQPADVAWRLTHPEHPGLTALTVRQVGATVIVMFPGDETEGFPQISMHGHTDPTVARQCAENAVIVGLQAGAVITEGPLVDVPLDMGAAFAEIVAQARNAGYQV